VFLALVLSSCGKPKTPITYTEPTTFAIVMSETTVAMTTASSVQNDLKPFEIPHKNDEDYYAKYVPSEDILTDEQTEVMKRFVLWQLFAIDPLAQMGGFSSEVTNIPIPTGVSYVDFYEYLCNTFSSNYVEKITGGEHTQYVNNDGELYIVAGMGGINPAYMKSEAILTSQSDNEISFTISIYEDTDDGTGNLKLSEYQPTLTMIKENDKWVIDSFEVLF
jgi:hypothetical protein